MSIMDYHLKLSTQKKKEQQTISNTKCPVCGFVAAYSWTLKDHILRRHTAEKPFKCSECPKRFVTNYELKKHLPAHSGELPHKCTVCFKGFKYRAARDHHEDSTHDMRHSCKLCCKIFTRRDELRHHKKVDHGPNKTDPQKFQCGQCFRNFSSHENLEEHRIQHKEHTCADCSFKFGGLHDLLVHRRTVHGACKERRRPSKPRAYNHSKVIKQTTNIREARVKKRPKMLNENMKMRKEGSNLYECKLCKDSFLRRQDLMNHVEDVHPLEKEKLYPYECPVCSKRFAAKSNLYQHSAVHKIKKYKCEHCDYSSVRGADLKYHVMKNHTPDAGRQFMCEFCSQTFTQKNELRYHINRHKNIKEFNCPKCGQGFFSRKAFVHHMESHEDKYLCSICGSVLKNSSCLRSHMKIHNVGISRLNHKPMFKKIASKLGFSSNSNVCMHCGCKVESSRDLKDHLSSCYNETGIVACKTCVISFPNDSFMRFHHLLEHGDHSIHYECHACGISCATAEDLDSHLKQHKKWLGLTKDQEKRHKSIKKQIYQVLNMTNSIHEEESLCLSLE